MLLPRVEEIDSEEESVREMHACIEIMEYPVFAFK